VVPVRAAFANSVSSFVKEDAMSIPAAPRILISRLSHIGDCVLTLPLLGALRRACPGAFIAWAVEKPADQLIGDHPDLNKLIVVPRGWLGSMNRFVAVRRTLRAERFNIVFDPQSLTKSSALGWVSGAALRIGMSRPFGRELAPWLNNCHIRPNSTHLVDRTMELLRGIEINHAQPELRLPVHPDVISLVQSTLAETAQSDFIVMNPGASWRSKQWEPDRFAVVARFAHQSLNLRTLVAWAGATEKRMAEQIAKMSGGSAIAAPPTNLKQLAALLSLAKMYVGGDTGPMHIAAAVGTTCVALFGPTRPVDSGPYGDGHVVLQAWYQSGTSRQRRGAANLAMRDISVEQVCDAVERVHARKNFAASAAA
jgi:ADP-heptose:LPS heptosyltransferase